MIRSSIGDKKYWAKWTDYGAERLKKEWSLIRAPSQNPDYGLSRSPWTAG